MNSECFFTKLYYIYFQWVYTYQTTFGSLVLAFYHVDPRDWTQVTRPGSKHFNLLSHLINPLCYASNMKKMVKYLNLREYVNLAETVDNVYMYWNIRCYLINIYNMFYVSV